MPTNAGWLTAERSAEGVAARKARGSGVLRAGLPTQDEMDARCAAGEFYGRSAIMRRWIKRGRPPGVPKGEPPAPVANETPASDSTPSNKGGDHNP